jgi:hypothetical protein
MTILLQVKEDISWQKSALYLSHGQCGCIVLMRPEPILQKLMARAKSFGRGVDISA